MVKRIALAVILFFMVLKSGYSQNADSVRVDIKPYSSFRGHVGFFNDEVEIQENASRIGLELSVMKRNFRFFASVELGINLFKGRQIFNQDANTNSGFITIDSTQQTQVFSNRLGFIGVDLGKYGQLSLGKQWSTFYDVTGFTDRFNVFGGRASATYVAKSDGGESGTGRASQSLIYKKSFKNLSIAGQLQFRTTLNNNWVDGFGFSAKYELLRGLNIAAAYNKSFLSDFFLENTLGLNGQPEYFTAGLSFVNESWDIGIVYSNQSNGDLTDVRVAGELVAAVYDANGVEIFVKFKQPRYALILGYNGYNPDANDIPVDPDYGVDDFILGAEFRPGKLAYLYGEYRISNGTTSIGTGDFNVLTLGLRIDLDYTFSRFLK